MTSPSHLKSLIAKKGIIVRQEIKFCLAIWQVSDRLEQDSVWP